MAQNVLQSTLLLPLKDQLATATLTKYRELLRKLRSNADALDESSTSFRQAKERVLYRLQQKRKSVRADPKGAFQRLRDRAAQARTSLLDLKAEQKQRFQSYYLNRLSNARWLQNQEKQSDVEDLAVQNILGSNGIFRSLVIAGVGGACKAYLNGVARTRVTGGEHFVKALERPEGQPLITVSNHVASIDDPLVTAAIVPTEYLGKPAALRWTLCATDRCFKNAALAPFFKAAKVLPVERGAGVSQRGMKIALQRLHAGDWVHIFPEGTRSKTNSMLPMRRGIGWLVANCEQPPLIVPFVHSGMETIMPSGAKLPRAGELNVLVGEPIVIEDILDSAAKHDWSEKQLHAAITDRIGASLYTLKAQLDNVSLDEIVPERSESMYALNEESLLPLIEAEVDSLQHRWKKKWEDFSALSGWRSRVKQQAVAMMEHANDISMSSNSQELDAEASSSSSESLTPLFKNGGLFGARFTKPEYTHGGSAGFSMRTDTTQAIVDYYNSRMHHMKQYILTNAVQN